MMPAESRSGSRLLLSGMLSSSAAVLRLPQNTLFSNLLSARERRSKKEEVRKLDFRLLTWPLSGGIFFLFKKCHFSYNAIQLYIHIYIIFVITTLQSYWIIGYLKDGLSVPFKANVVNAIFLLLWKKNKIYICIITGINLGRDSAILNALVYISTAVFVKQMWERCSTQNKGLFKNLRITDESWAKELKKRKYEGTGEKSHKTPETLTWRQLKTLPRGHSMKWKHSSHGNNVMFLASHRNSVAPPALYLFAPPAVQD